MASRVHSGLGRLWEIVRGLGMGRSVLSRHRLALLWISAISLGAAHCGSPTAPVESTPLPLLVYGTVVLTSVGQTSQLTVTTNAGASVTSGLTWQTSTANVATVSVTGLVTATGFGATTVTATAAGAKGTLSLSVVQVGTATTTISACQAITAPGSYVLNSDLQPAGRSRCLTVVGVSAVQLDCRGHAVSGVFLSHANTVTITNCVITGGENAGDLPVIIDNGNTVTVTNCIMTASATDAVYLDDGINNRVLQSTITGGYPGGPASVGADDGIVLVDETGDTIQGNTISNVFDAGIEGADTVANTTIASNTITNTGANGIGTYWCTNWTHNVVRLNNVSQSGVMFYADYQVDATKCGAGAPSASFTGNSIIGNRFRNPTVGTVPLVLQGMVAKFVAGTPVSGNLIQGNDFGTQGCPLLSPAQGFIDGGGNICATTTVTASAMVRAHGGSHGHLAGASTVPGNTWFLELLLAGTHRASWTTFGDGR
jgi:parallel beta-helix repeat protein